MTSLRHGIAAEHALSLPIAPRSDLSVDGQVQRTASVMRKYDVSALLPDLTVSFRQIVAPATPLFEECASAFARGTLIQTVNGPVAVEDLMPGDYIETASGSVPVTWIGSTTYVPGHSEGQTTLKALTRITGEGFGYGAPGMDVLCGPAARMIVRHDKLRKLLGQDAVLAPVQDYVDGDRYLEVTPGGTVQLYHLMVNGHTTIKVGGVEFETYHPGKAAGQALGPNLRALFLSMFPNVTDLDDFGQVSMTRTQREVIESLLDT
ncbi:Hint domain-containing protein [Tropicibacter naphthalenivorans]|uniref:Hedgehog/Intein (Hint) domain-containing protein n=1 Tax=Tropicibacter naphthalenivorans TaxID=441103 RepID=A0A0P1FZQ7_9RHOB|nr:Hint domain-containing protein [Tropicibacter naphthalenivorans]CUH74885.1 hypothetical protein TRN7648_00135 [Tropicibacter naphthalenivorans]SMC48351.1 Hint domain-containing protein [Tropicibacter naphthalenivorans]